MVYKRGFFEEVRELRERELHPGAAGGVRRRGPVEDAGLLQRRGDIQEDVAAGAGAGVPEPMAAARRLSPAVHGRRQRRRRRQGTLVDLHTQMKTQNGQPTANIQVEENHFLFPLFAGGLFICLLMMIFLLLEKLCVFFFVI